MTTLNKILDYYKHYIEVQRLYLELADKRWIIEEYPPIQLGSTQPYFSTRDDMINRLYKLLKDNAVYMALSPKCQESVRYCLGYLERDKDVHSIFIDSEDNTATVSGPRFITSITNIYNLI